MFNLILCCYILYYSHLHHHLPFAQSETFLTFLSYSSLFKPSPPFGDIHLTLPPPSSHWIKHYSNDYQIFPWPLSPCFTTSTTSPLVPSRSFPLSSWCKPVLSFTKVATMNSKPWIPEFPAPQKCFSAIRQPHHQHICVHQQHNIYLWFKTADTKMSDVIDVHSGFFQTVTSIHAMGADLTV